MELPLNADTTMYEYTKAMLVHWLNCTPTCSVAMLVLLDVYSLVAVDDRDEDVLCPTGLSSM